MRNARIIGCIVVAALGLSTSTLADSFVKADGSYRTIDEVLMAERIVLVRELFEAWNDGTLSFPSKETLEPYVLAFREPLSCPGQEPRYEMRNVSLDSWGELPQSLVPELPIDTGAQLFLLGLVEGNLPALAELDDVQFGNQLLRGAYMVLGTAQILAMNAGASQIRTGFVWGAMQDYPFMIDPFNPAICPRDSTTTPAPE